MKITKWAPPLNPPMTKHTAMRNLWHVPCIEGARCNYKLVLREAEQQDDVPAGAAKCGFCLDCVRRDIQLGLRSA